MTEIGTEMTWGLAGTMAGERVLIVDDNASSLKLIAYVMRKGGYDVTLACDGESALESTHRHHPEIVLMDIQLPGMDGLEVVRRLRADPSCREILIIAVSAYAMKGDAEKALAAGCDDYIVKPIDTRTLADLIARHLDRRAHGA